MHMCLYVRLCRHLHTCIHLVSMGTSEVVQTPVPADAVLTTNVGGSPERRCGRGEGRALVSVGGPDPQAREEFGSFDIFLLDQIIR